MPTLPVPAAKEWQPNVEDASVMPSCLSLVRLHLYFNINHRYLHLWLWPSQSTKIAPQALDGPSDNLPSLIDQIHDS